MLRFETTVMFHARVGTGSRRYRARPGRLIQTIVRSSHPSAICLPSGPGDWGPGGSATPHLFLVRSLEGPRDVRKTLRPRWGEVIR